MFCVPSLHPTVLARYQIWVIIVTAAPAQIHVKACWSNSVQPGNNPLAFRSHWYHKCAPYLGWYEPWKANHSALHGGSEVLQPPRQPIWDAFLPSVQGRKRPKFLPSIVLQSLPPMAWPWGGFQKSPFSLTTWLFVLSFWDKFSTISLKGSKWEGISSWAWEWLLPVLPHSGPEKWVNKRPSPFQRVG